MRLAKLEQTRIASMSERDGCDGMLAAVAAVAALATLAGMLVGAATTAAALTVTAPAQKRQALMLLAAS